MSFNIKKDQEQTLFHESCWQFEANSQKKKRKGPEEFPAEQGLLRTPADISLPSIQSIFFTVHNACVQ